MKTDNLSTPSSIEGSFSWFAAPIRNVLPLRTITIPELYELIATDFLKSHTERVRKGIASKSDILPYVTSSGVFKKRNISNLVSYSGIICMDADDCDISLKCKLAADTVLKPPLIFLSPSGTGLKILIQITNARSEDHLAYYNAIAHYLLENYQLAVDKSGSDIPRACYACFDPEAFYNPDGFVTSEALLKLLPKPAPASPATAPVRATLAVAPVSKTTASVRNLPPAAPSASTGDKPSDRLNKMTEIHNMAVNALERNGWQQNGELWTRPDKEVNDGCSAKYNIWEQEGIWFFTCFSSNAFPFKAHKGYTDCQIVCLLNFADDWTSCISDLASRFLEPV